MKKRILLIIIAVSLSIFNINAQEWQWSVTLSDTPSSETDGHPHAFLWVPPHARQIKGVVFGMHNMIEEGIFDNPIFRKSMSELGFAVVWVTPKIDVAWDPAVNPQRSFEKMMGDFADVSGYKELRYAPVVPIGHSALATFPWNFAAFSPQRTLAILSVHGDSPQTKLTGYGRKNVEWGNNNIDGIPGLMVEGEYEWWEARVNPSLKYRKEHPKSCVSFLCDAGHGHFDYSDAMIAYLCKFIKKSAAARLPKIMPTDRYPELVNVNPDKGWLCDRWRPDSVSRCTPASYQTYKGNRDDSFWYFDEDMAKATEAFYATSRGKKNEYIGYVQQGHLVGYDSNLHAREISRFIPEKDGLTFHISAAYTDSSRIVKSDDNCGKPIVISRICGPVKKVNDTTFTVRFYRMGFDNDRRTADIWLIANSAGDKDYKSTVQQTNMTINYPNKDGEAQSISFDNIPDQRVGIKEIPLKATATSGMAVHFYVKEGPAEIVERGDNSYLKFTDIPVRAKMPMKVTVVAWQIGRRNAPKVQTAQPVERTLRVTKAQGSRLKARER